jgi:hypothetical protein
MIGRHGGSCEANINAFHLSNKQLIMPNADADYLNVRTVCRGPWPRSLSSCGMPGVSVKLLLLNAWIAEFGFAQAAVPDFCGSNQ